jgi:hypothetical protein
MGFLNITQVSKIDAEWWNNGSSPDALRLVHTKRDTLLTVPSLNGSAPTYQYRSHSPKTGDYKPGYYHLSGPTLAEWQAQQDDAEASREAHEMYEFASGR